MDGTEADTKREKEDPRKKRTDGTEGIHSPRPPEADVDSAEAEPDRGVHKNGKRQKRDGSRVSEAKSEAPTPRAPTMARERTMALEGSSRNKKGRAPTMVVIPVAASRGSLERRAP
jgi:hypothetical protein